MIPNYILLCQQIGANPNCHQRGIIKQLKGTKAETHSQTLGRAKRTLQKKERKDYGSPEDYSPHNHGLCMSLCQVLCIYVVVMQLGLLREFPIVEARVVLTFFFCVWNLFSPMELTDSILDMKIHTQSYCSLLCRVHWYPTEACSIYLFFIFLRNQKKNGSREEGSRGD